jgi:bloom syndrome protein
VSQWGHDFRPDYKTLNVLKRELPDVPLLALTATATEQVKKDVIRQLEVRVLLGARPDSSCRLQLRDPTEFTQSFNRPNLRYAVRLPSPLAAFSCSTPSVFSSCAFGSLLVLALCLFPLICRPIVRV